MTIFRAVAGVMACTSCAEVIDGTGWRPKAAHVCRNRAEQLTARADRVQYVDALAYIDALARLDAEKRVV